MIEEVVRNPIERTLAVKCPMCFNEIGITKVIFDPEILKNGTLSCLYLCDSCYGSFDVDFTLERNYRAKNYK